MTQALGSSFTVRDGNLFRIAGKAATRSARAARRARRADDAGAEIETAVWQQLRVLRPEIPINIVGSVSFTVQGARGER
jgi:hypothetical protein